MKLILVRLIGALAEWPAEKFTRLFRWAVDYQIASNKDVTPEMLARAREEALARFRTQDEERRPS